jgi:hypothetical protein
MGLALIVAAALQVSVTAAYANKVDCDKVMTEVKAGKKGTEIAKDLGVSPSSVYRCKKKAATAKAGGKSAAGPVAAASAAAAPSPASSK